MDSPKCPYCFKAGALSQTYKMVGVPRFKCQKCKNLFDKSEFDSREFLWKTEFHTWKEMMDKRVMESSKKEELDKQIIELEAIARKKK